MNEPREKNGWDRNHVWSTIAKVLLGSMAGWWGRQLTLEIPPAWFRRDVENNTFAIREHDKRLDTIEKSDRYLLLMDRLHDIEREIRQPKPSNAD